ncbi:MAG TPA: tetratricopeptide repeat protein, partial [Alphaproteobacteria bacterium]|nr:tetratricopeptide repeat protein [Alphaproteobacteria bacterium]
MKVLNRLATSKLALAGLVAGVMLGACDGSAGTGEQSYIERAVQYRAEGKLAAAVIELKNAVQQNPESAEARLLLGELYLQAGDPVSAEKELRRARDLGADPAEAGVPLMQAWIAVGKNTDVLHELDKPEVQAALDPVDRSNLRGQAYLALGRTADARTEFETSIRQEPNEQAFSSLAWIAIIDGRLERAEHYLAEGQAIAPDSPNLAMVEGELDLYRDDYEAAEGEFRRLVEDNPKNYRALFGLARAQIGGGDTKDAIGILDG